MNFTGRPLELTILTLRSSGRPEASRPKSTTAGVMLKFGRFSMATRTVTGTGESLNSTATSLFSRPSGSPNVSSVTSRTPPPPGAISGKLFDSPVQWQSE